MQKSIIISIIISLSIIGAAYYYSSDKTSDVGDNVSKSFDQQASNVEIKDGIQYVTILAKGGYSPRVSKIEPNIPTKLIVKTDNTYDCSSSLVIRSIGYRKILQPSGEEIIDIGSPESGTKISGTCSMGMYNFRIDVD